MLDRTVRTKRAKVPEASRAEPDILNRSASPSEQWHKICPNPTTQEGDGDTRRIKGGSDHNGIRKISGEAAQKGHGILLRNKSLLVGCLRADRGRLTVTPYLSASPARVSPGAN